VTHPARYNVSPSPSSCYPLVCRKPRGGEQCGCGCVEIGPLRSRADLIFKLVRRLLWASAVVSDAADYEPNGWVRLSQVPCATNALRLAGDAGQLSDALTRPHGSVYASSMCCFVVSTGSCSMSFATQGDAIGACEAVFFGKSAQRPCHGLIHFRQRVACTIQHCSRRDTSPTPSRANKYVGMQFAAKSSRRRRVGGNAKFMRQRRNI